MKEIYSLFFLFSLPFILSAALNPNSSATLFDHLKEVNQEWTKQTEDFDFLQNTAHFQKDEDRIQLHLYLVEKTLRARDDKHLSNSQKINRLHHLDILKTYAENAIFPQNIYHSERQPYFVDHIGTACAVGHLIRESGETELVDLITKQDNFTYISELVKYKKLIVWAEENGFSLAELAWIQPGYPPVAKQINQVGNGGGANGEITVMQHQTSNFYIAGNFTEIDGFAANGIVRWDGENWSNLGEGLSGEIDKIETNMNLVIVSGNFTIVATGQQTQLAIYKDGEWSSLLSENFTGEIRDITSIGLGDFSGMLYVGGDFSEIDGNSYQNIAQYSLINSSWLHSGLSCNLGTNAPVNSVFSTGEKIYFAGEFSEISQNCSSEPINLETNALGIFDHYANTLSPQPFFGGFEKIDEVHVNNGVLRAYEHRETETYVHGLTGGTWSSIPYINTDASAAATLYGFTQTYGTNPSTFIYGNTREGGGISVTFGNGIVVLSSDGYPSSSGVILPNSTIRAASYYNGQIYFAGDFTEIQGESFNGLASSDFSVQTAIEPEISELGEIQVFQDYNQLITRFKDLEHETNFTLYNMNGKAIASQKLAVGSGQVEMNLWNTPAGMYFYTVENESGMRSEKVLIMQ